MRACVLIFGGHKGGSLRDIIDCIRCCCPCFVVVGIPLGLDVVVIPIPLPTNVGVTFHC